MSELPPDPREETNNRIKELTERRARLLVEIAEAEDELLALTGSKEPTAED